MKLPLTDKFLWELYNFLEKTEIVHEILAPRPWKEIWSPELRQFRSELRKKQRGKIFSQFIYYLKKKGYIKIKNLKEKQAILITQKGAHKVLRIRLMMKERKRRLDKKWQMIIFDIPEKKRYLRKLLRNNLRLLGYSMFQQSVWICPYDVLKETKAVLSKYYLDPYVKLFLIEEIEL